MDLKLLTPILLSFFMASGCLANSLSGQAVGTVAHQGWIESSPGFNVRTSPETYFRAYNKDCVQLFSGELLLVAKASGVVITPLAVTYVKADSIVLFRVNTGIERVFVLSVPGKNSVATIANNHAARLHAGHEVVVTDHQPRIRETRQSDSIGRREFRAFSVGHDLYMTTTEFSIWHVVSLCPLFQASDPLSRWTRAQVLKTANVVDLVMAKHGEYLTQPLDELLDFEPL
ncbi:MAG: hypothetical protein K2Y22_04455 [Candidatus Obscuribacterales bacterium]|nr:hypothetical protein [Candidatus Obscuribacterales bacterium]